MRAILTSLALAALLAACATSGSSVPLAASVTLSWAPVTQLIDGDPVQVSAYRVYAGSAPSVLAPVQAVAAPLTSCSLTGLSAGTHYLAVTALAGELESAKSAVVTVTIP